LDFGLPEPLIQSHIIRNPTSDCRYAIYLDEHLERWSWSTSFGFGLGFWIIFAFWIGAPAIQI